jgi:hypothetical protein
MFSTVLLVHECSERSASSTEVTLLLNLENRSKTCVIPIACSQKHTCNIPKVSAAFLPV